jgi:APA family basic amino acid/polyamine antiporter
LGLIVFRNADVWAQNFSAPWSHGQLVRDATGHWNWQMLSTFGLVTALGTALVGSLFSSDAWNNVTFISGDIEDPKRNIPLSLFFGTTDRHHTLCAFQYGLSELAADAW